MGEKLRIVRPEILPYAKRVLSEKGYPFSVITDKNGIRLSTSLSSREYHRVIEEAMCLEQQGSSRIPVCSKNMIDNRNTPNAYHILRKDRKRSFYAYN